MTKFRLFGGFLIYLLFVIIMPDANAQFSPFNQRDDQYPLLGLKRAKEAYDAARSEHVRQKQLFDKQLISEKELETARRNFSDAEVNYQQAILSVLFEKQYVAVIKAIKYQSDDGRKHVRLRLENTSGGTPEFKKLINIDDKLFKALQPNVINDVYVSLLNNENTIISQPYEAKIEELIYGKPAELNFKLLQDLDAVTVQIFYGSGTERSPKIYLQKDKTVNKVIVQSEQFSQEVELGASASYNMTLELFSGVNNTFKLEVVNLPQQINRYFVDPGTQARLSQFKFAESTNTRNAALEIYLPDRPTEEVKIDQPIPFYVMVIPRDQSKKLGDVKKREWTQKEIENLNVGYVRLELIPRGVGKLLVRAPQLYYSIKANETVEMGIEVVNEGTRRLDNIEVTADPPLKWSKRISPPVISSLDIREEKHTVLNFTPPEEVSVGKYEIRIQTTSFADNQPINGEDKVITVEIQPEANVLGTTIIISLIVGLVFGIVIFGIRLSRR